MLDIECVAALATRPVALAKPANAPATLDVSVGSAEVAVGSGKEGGTTESAVGASSDIGDETTAGSTGASAPREGAASDIKLASASIMGALVPTMLVCNGWGAHSVCIKEAGEALA